MVHHEFSGQPNAADLFIFLALCLSTRGRSSMVEQGTHNPLVVGSSPAAPTTAMKGRLRTAFAISSLPSSGLSLIFLVR